MTMKQLAELAHVSVSTVSKAFYDAEDISAETKEQIFALAREHGCYGQFYKGKYNKKIIAIICPELAGSFYTAYLLRLQKVIEEAGGICIISADNFDPKKQAELIEYYASYLKVDGLFVIGLKARLKKGYSLPVVALFHSADETVDTVGLNSTPVIAEAIKILQEAGHRDIAFIGEELTMGKQQYFLQAGGCRELTVTSPFRFEEAGMDGIRRLREQGKKFTALICAYDYIAFGAIRQLKKEGLRVPEDVSVIGMNNISLASFSETSLSTVDAFPDEICRIAWELMKKKLENKYFHSTQNIQLQPRLILRESIKKRTES